MAYDDLIVLIPSHSLEDFPVELADDEAASLLNSFVVPWHPALLAAAKALPRWHRADDPPDAAQRRLIMLPKNCESWVPAGWAERVSGEGAVVVRGMTDRTEMLQLALLPLDGQFQVSADLAADFLALGFCYLQIELLTRKMRNFSNLDEVHLQREAVAAAEAALAGDETTARTRLRSCFEVLTEGRERFYSVDCYLLDLCLLIPRLADQHLIDTLLNLKPMNLLVSASDLPEIARENPAALAAVREAWDRGTLDVAGGEYREAATPLLPPGSILWQLRRGRTEFETLLGHRPKMWARRRYGVFPQLPQILKKSGFHGDLHAVLDDGIYPDAEHTKIRWEGIDGSVIDAVSRIPLAADSASSYLRFATRMAESMDDDQVAGLIFARWPEVKAPWFDDLRRMHQYSPVLGRFVTFDDFFRHTDNQGRLTSYKPHEYLTPFLVQSVAYQEINPISRYTGHFLRRQQYESGCWHHGLRAILTGRSPDAATSSEVERLLEELPDDATPEAVQQADEQVAAFASDGARRLADLVMSGGGQQPGYLVLNPLGFRRVVGLELPGNASGGAETPAGTAAGADATPQRVTVDLPGAGFAWIPSVPAETPPAALPMAEPNLLRNELFEVHISEQTGGLMQIKGYGRSPNRLSQQLNYRFSRERTFRIGEGDDAEEIKSHYAEMRVETSEVRSAGPVLGEIVTAGQIVDQKTGQRLAGFRQAFRVWRHRPVLELNIDLDVDRMPDAEPWHNYYAARFAWNDETASLTRSMLQGAHEIREDRFESPHYIEIAADAHRTTILPMGLPFQRKTGPRMIDSLLVVPKEGRRRFQFVIAIDQNYPMQAALDAMTPPAVIPTAGGPPRSGAAGWFFHLNARSVQIQEILPLLAEPVDAAEAWSQTESESPKLIADAGCGLRLMETEGRSVRARLRCLRPPVRARQRDLLGKTITDLTIDGDAVLIDLVPYEIADVEIGW